ncbi:DEAD/DEAH box helicase [Clostridium grantii]|uniref:ATP-dependent RNA helicase CshA n=1 Tax=Clostridium grantii DSM 8605 TaxID=1121316 RepID=A0A1M5QND7_9CLOT|nr:DEAD/DEAH box helicase [Clostridium grantii]SHH15329.1 ATP-dependent RNA helicase DeaD [Clostridium grantii DSM 8605]
MNFNELNISEEILLAIGEMGFTEATPIQAQTIPLILEGKDIIGQSHTGTGKTAAFAIPILEQIDVNNKNIQALILCPTRELAVQVSNEFDKLGKHMKNLRCLPVYGGESIRNQILSLKKGVQIVIGTPGRVIDHINRGTMILKDLKYMVLDEADEMLNMGFREDIESILEKAKGDRQTTLFSATMPKSILDITHKYQTSPTLVKVTKKEVTNSDIEQCYFEVREKYKLEALNRLIQVYNPSRALIFCNTKLRVDKAAQYLKEKGFVCDKIHGDIVQSSRMAVLEKFNSGKINILVATDVAARGLDISEVDVVFNHDVPENEEYYVHRVGRTGRAGKSGKSFTLVSEIEGRRISNIMAYINKKIEKRAIPSLEKANLIKIDSYVNDLKLILENENVSLTNPIIDKLLEEGYSIHHVAAALIHPTLDFENEDDIDFSYLKRNNRDRNSRDRNDRSDRSSRSPRRDSGNRAPAGDVTRFHINIGKDQDVRPGDIVGAIAGECNIPGSAIGNIDLYDKFSFVEVPTKYENKILQVMNKETIKGKKVFFEKAKARRER